MRLDQALATTRLTGLCGRCGGCCTEIDERGERLVCEHLDVFGAIGQPLSTRCRVYETRANRPIRMIDRTGLVAKTGVCVEGDWRETVTILPWIGRGCSLKAEVVPG